MRAKNETDKTPVFNEPDTRIFMVWTRYGN